VSTSVQVVFDCADPDRLAHFWATALGYKLQDPPQGFASWQEFLIAQHIPQELWNARSAVIDPQGTGPRLFFQRVPEPKTLKNRVHLDLNISGGFGVPLEQRQKLVNLEVERLLGAGATSLRTGDENGEYWVVMADPEGNEFCVH
jgi:catechol 2,3-dioxygenase-like lactoylglutathione lyase family enzyme